MIEAWLLDVDYITESGKAIVRLWCKDEKGVFVAYDRSFQPYFYVLGCEKEDVLNVKLGSDGEITPLRVEEVKKKSLGVDVEVLKVYAKHPQHVPKLRDFIKGFADVREADIPFAYRYLIDKDLACLDGIAIEPISKRDGKLRTYEVKSVQRIEIHDLPNLKVLAFDCEMLSPFMPDPERDPIVAISLKTEDLEDVLHGDERKVLRGFVNTLKETDPDVIVGYNQDRFDFPYLKKRCEKHGIKLDIGRDRSELTFRGGRPKIAGRLDVDLYDIALKIPDVKIKTLKNVAEFLGKRIDDEISGRDIYRCWQRGEIEKILKHALNDVIATYYIADELLPMYYELSRLIRLPLDDVTRMGRGKQVEYLLLSEAYRIGEIAPNPPEMEESYEGAFVLEPKRGLHEDVFCVDFSSMYPSIMIAFNISPDTLVKGMCDECYVTPEVGHRFRRHPDGFFKRILKMLIERRKSIKRKMKVLNPKSEEYRILNIKQQTLKILTNSIYGYTGWNMGRWYCKECAEATTAWGRYFIRKAVKMAEEMGFDVLYGDTDSLFLKKNGLTPERLREEVEKLIDVVSKELPIQLDIDEFYRVVFFVEKKRYAGLTRDGRIVVKGLEVKRGDWCELAKKVQRRVIEIILRERNPKKALDYVNGVVRDIKSGKVALEDYVIYKGITKKPEKYESKQAHVKAFLRAREMGIRYPIGTKIGFVVVSGFGSISDRAYPIDLVEDFDGVRLKIKRPSGVEVREIDKAYYIDHQVVPSVLRILERFGYDESHLKGVRITSTQRTLFEF